MASAHERKPGASAAGLLRSESTRRRRRLPSTAIARENSSFPPAGRFRVSWYVVDVSTDCCLCPSGGFCCDGFCCGAPRFARRLLRRGGELRELYAITM